MMRRRRRRKAGTLPPGALARLEAASLISGSDLIAAV